MNILHVIPAFHPAHIYGGPIQSTYELCTHLPLDFCKVRVLTTDADGAKTLLEVETEKEIRLAVGVRLRYCKRVMRHSVSPLILRLLPRYILWADVVHLTAVYSFPTIPTLLACKVLRKPVIWSSRGALQRWQGSTRPMLKYIWESVCRAAAPSRLILHTTSEDEARESKMRMPGVETVMIPNGVEIPDSITHVPANGRIRLLYLGRLHPIKGIENLLAACRILNERGAQRRHAALECDRLGALVGAVEVHRVAALDDHVVGHGREGSARRG